MGLYQSLFMHVSIRTLTSFLFWDWYWFPMAQNVQVWIKLITYGFSLRNPRLVGDGVVLETTVISDLRVFMWNRDSVQVQLWDIRYSLSLASCMCFMCKVSFLDSAIKVYLGLISLVGDCMCLLWILLTKVKHILRLKAWLV